MVSPRLRIISSHRTIEKCFQLPLNTAKTCIKISYFEQFKTDILLLLIFLDNKYFEVFILFSSKILIKERNMASLIEDINEYLLFLKYGLLQYLKQTAVTLVCVKISSALSITVVSIDKKRSFN